MNGGKEEMGALCCRHKAKKSSNLGYIAVQVHPDKSNVIFLLRVCTAVHCTQKGSVVYNNLMVYSRIHLGTRTYHM